MPEHDNKREQCLRGTVERKQKRMSCHEPVANRRVKASFSHPSYSGSFSHRPPRALSLSILSFSGLTGESRSKKKPYHQPGCSGRCPNMTKRGEKFRPLFFCLLCLFLSHCHTRATTRVSRSKNKQINHLDYPIKSGNDRKEKVLLLPYRPPPALSFFLSSSGLTRGSRFNKEAILLTWMSGSNPNVTEK